MAAKANKRSGRALFGSRRPIASRLAPEKKSDSPMKLMADGKKLAKFWLQWSVIGICRYLMVPLCSNTFGKLGVTFTTNCND